jgi:hypothetical protein
MGGEQPSTIVLGTCEARWAGLWPCNAVAFTERRARDFMGALMGVYWDGLPVWVLCHERCLYDGAQLYER